MIRDSGDLFPRRMLLVKPNLFYLTLEEVNSNGIDFLKKLTNKKDKIKVFFLLMIILITVST
jgi:two-component SAPR family response regulator